MFSFIYFIDQLLNRLPGGASRCASSVVVIGLVRETVCEDGMWCCTTMSPTQREFTVSSYWMRGAQRSSRRSRVIGGNHPPTQLRIRVADAPVVRHLEHIDVDAPVLRQQADGLEARQDPYRRVHPPSGSPRLAGHRGRCTCWAVSEPSDRRRRPPARSGPCVPSRPARSSPGSRGPWDRVPRWRGRDRRWSCSIRRSPDPRTADCRRPQRASQVPCWRSRPWSCSPRWRRTRARSPGRPRR